MSVLAEGKRQSVSESAARGGRMLHFCAGHPTRTPTHKVLLAVVELLPVLGVAAQVHLLGCSRRYRRYKGGRGRRYGARGGRGGGRGQRGPGGAPRGRYRGLHALPGTQCAGLKWGAAAAAWRWQRRRRRLAHHPAVTSNQQTCTTEKAAGVARIPGLPAWGRPPGGVAPRRRADSDSWAVGRRSPAAPQYSNAPVQKDASAFL